MRLSDLMSKPIKSEYLQVENFMGCKRIKRGATKKISVGKISLNFFCKKCNDIRTFNSEINLNCLSITNNFVSVDTVLTCCNCESSVQTWFLIESKNEVSSIAPEVRINKIYVNLNANKISNPDEYGEFTELLEKSKRAAEEGLGAGAIIYLRKIFEQITTQVAIVEKIPTKNKKGRSRIFKEILEDVDKQRHIIPNEFSKNGYQLFRELSNVIHGESDENKALEKYDSLYRLVVGVIENVKNNSEIMIAIGKLGWKIDDESD